MSAVPGRAPRSRPAVLAPGADHSLIVAGHQARSGDAAGCKPTLSHGDRGRRVGRVGAQRKGIVHRAVLGEADDILAAPGQDCDELAHSVARMKAVLAGSAEDAARRNVRARA